MEWVETTGKSVPEAKDAALDRLGVHEDDAEFEIVAEEKTGMFGRVKEDARVRARVRPSTPRAKEAGRKRRNRGGQGEGRTRGGARGSRGRTQGAKGGQTPENNTESGDSSKHSGRTDKREAQSNNRQKQKPRQDRAKKETTNVSDESTGSAQPNMSLPEQADVAQEFVTGLAERFGASVSFDRTDISDDEIRLTVGGENLGRMIGQRGNTASAVDELVRTVLQRRAGSGRDGRVRVDVGGVRARRAEALGEFSRKQAEAVRESGVARSLEPMNGSDRKIVHDSLSDEVGVRTLSEGEDPNRRVVIVPDGDAD